MKKLFFLFCTIVSSYAVHANNIQVANISIDGQNTASHFEMINFDVSWENSWRTNTNESNYDGAWIFVKFRKHGTTVWQHASLNTTGFIAPAGSTIQVSGDNKGAWIYRNAAGAGNVNFENGQLRWNYGADGVADNDSVEVRVFAVEMVYIPQGSFYLGTGGSEWGNFRDGSTTNPYYVTSEDAITKGTASGNLNALAPGPIPGGMIPAAYPKGYHAFWIMKYECSQQQYLDFLLCLDEARCNLRNPPTNFTGTYPALTAVAPERAVANCNLNDWLAYADWAALRPFTELEYEKACRGVEIVPTPNEYAWGNTSLTVTGSVTNSGAFDETANNGNCNIITGYGAPVRCGIYATSTSDRTASGATYYGVMEMTGNVWENVVGTIHATHVAFTGAVHGDGNIDANAVTDIPTWTAISLSAAQSQRGGGFIEPIAYGRTSDRIAANGSTSYDVRAATNGIRAARTAE